MALTLYVDAPRWHAHLEGVRDTHPGLVPVIKGNGYGLGVARLAAASSALGLDTIAVGTYREIPVAAAEFAGTVMVLTPWRPSEDPEHVVHGDHVVHTVGRLEDLEALCARPGTRVVLERLTSMRRHGFSAAGLRQAVALWAERGGVRLEGVALHLPMLAAGSGQSHMPEVERLMTDVVAAGVPVKQVWVSHLSDSELATLATRYLDFELRPRMGTGLWLGDRGALAVRARVLDVHAVERGDVFGYRGRAVPSRGHLLVVSGGTAHGIGLEAPTGGSRLRDRALRVARGGLDAAGFVRSPFSVGGKPRLFAEPPHMQASMLFLPRGVRPPAIGDEVDVRVRFTTTDVDETVLV